MFRLGAAVTLSFIVLRATNFYGDPAPWTVQETWLSTLLSFINCEKYPPSLLYLMMTLGPALMLLASFEHARGAFARLLATFGQVPFFYYVVHIYLIHGLAVATGLAMTGTLTRTPSIGLSLAGIYLVWLLVLVLLYPICRWFAELKESGRGGGGAICDRCRSSRARKATRTGCRLWTVAHEANQGFASNPLGAKQPDEIIGTADCDLIERQKHVALLQACQCRRPTRLYPADAHGLRACPERQRQPPR